MDLFHRLARTSVCLSENDMENVLKLTFVKEVYSCWESNDEGEDFDLYTGLAADGVTPRYFLKHFSRDWYGGWTHDETRKWYEISEQEYLQVCGIA